MPPQQSVIATVHCPEEAPLLEQIEGLRKPIMEAVKQAKWAGGKVQIDATVHIGILMFLEKAVKMINDLTQELEGLKKHIHVATGEVVMGMSEEEEALVAVD